MMYVTFPDELTLPFDVHSVVSFSNSNSGENVLVNFFRQGDTVCIFSYKGFKLAHPIGR